MTTLFKADIFFFITSAVVIALGIGLVIVLIYLIRILRNVKDISETVKEESAAVAGDISHLRSTVKSGRLLAGLFLFIKRMFGRKSKNHKSH